MKRLKRFGKQIMIALLLVSLNINPIGIVVGAIYESGIVDRMSGLGQRLYQVSTGMFNNVEAAELTNPFETPTETVITCDCDCDLPLNEYGEVKVRDNTVVANIRYSNMILNDIDDDIIETRTVMMQKFDVVISELKLINEKLDEILKSLHHYRVAHVYSLNNFLGNALYRPHTEDLPYVEDYVTVTGQFANVYTGYWDANVPDVINPLPAERALEVLGYDAIIRSEGVRVASTQQLADMDAQLLPSEDTVTGESMLSTAGKLQHVPTQEELEWYNKLTEEEKEVYGIHPENKSVTPNGDMLVLEQEFIPEDNITWLDAATVLYKALDQHVYTYKSFYTRNTNITPENSPLSQNLSGVKEFDGFDYYMFTTRNNLIEGDTTNKTTTYLYWVKAINDGVVSYENMNKPIKAWEFYGLATSLMQAYGEPVMNDDEIKALLQVYGDEYPVQLGTEIADDWAYLKARGVLAKDLGLDISSTMSREQLLDICMRIKDKTAREDYKTIQISLDIGQLMRDNGYYPVYDLDWGVNEFDVTTIIDYAAMTDYTYLLAAPDGLSLNELGYGFIYTKPEFDETKLLAGAAYNGKIKVDGKYYYRVSVPKSWNENFYLGFTYILDEKQRNGVNDFIEVTSDNLGGGIYTSYTVKDQIATVDKKEVDVNYYTFNHRSQDKNLRQFADIERCDVSEKEVAKASYGVSVNASIFEKALAFVDEMTTPIIAHAATGNGDAWKKEFTVRYNGTGQYTAEGKLGENFKQLSNISGIDILTSQAEVLVPQTKLATSLGRYMYIRNLYDNTPYDPAKWSHGGKSPGNGYNAIFPDGLNTVMSPGWWTMYGLALGDQVSSPTEVNSALDSTIKNIYGVNESELRTLFKVYNDITKVEGPMLSLSNAVNYKIYGPDRTSLDAALNELAQTESTSGADIIQGVEDAWAELDYSVTTDTIMSRDENLLISWSALKASGLAWSISKTTDDYTYNQEMGTYSFMTGQGSVLINEIYQYMQVGTTLYTFQNGDKQANLVYVDPDISEKGYQEVYFDVRCVLGLVNRRFEAISETEVVEQTKSVVGVGGDAEYSLQPGQAVGLSDETIFGQKSYAIYNFPEVPGLNGFNGDIKAYKTSLITDTIYDNMQVGPNDGDKYWDDGESAVKDKKMMRISMSHFNPTANYVLCVSDMGTNSGIGVNGITASLFVYYPRTAFTVGIDDDGTGSITSKPSGSNWKSYFDKQYQEAQVHFAASQYSGDRGALNDVAKAYDSGYATIDDMANGDWIDTMTAAALMDLFAYTGRVYIEQDYVVREFDLTNNFLAGVAKSQDFREAPNDEVVEADEPGYIYWIPNVGFVYNMPKYEDFTLTDYYNGKYPLPMAIGNFGVITYNMNSYGSFASQSGNSSVTVPIGWELTDNGYMHYKYSDSIKGYPLMSELPCNKGSVDSDSNLIAPFNVSEFTPAPSGVYARYGIWRQDLLHTIDAKSLTEAYTMSEAVYYGSRRVFATNAGASSGNYEFTYGSTSFNPIVIPAETKAYICMQSQDSSGTLFASYVMPRTTLIESESKSLKDIKEIPLYSEDEVDWTGRAKLTHFLDMIDKGTNWIMYVVFTIAPMICVILMTLLIGMSFMTDSKLWLLFCDKCFDPVKVLTFGVKSSTEWNWRRVLIPCIITYTAFALFANANILKIIVWVVDAWVRITSFIK